MMIRQESPTTTEVNGINECEVFGRESRDTAQYLPQASAMAILNATAQSLLLIWMFPALVD